MVEHDNRSRAMLFTFEDPETREVRSAVALNEAHARMRLGGVWDESEERTPARAPRQITEIHAVRDEALGAERAAQRAMLAANPIMQNTKYSSGEAFDEFASCKQTYEKLKAYREEIDRIMADLSRG